MGSQLFQRVSELFSASTLQQQLESAPGFSFITRSAQPFLAALLHKTLPTRPLLIVVEGLKTQESFHQELTTWLNEATTDKKSGSASAQAKPQRPLFFPGWEALPHETKLPHADVISERLETLLALSAPEHPTPIIVTTAAALMQRTFSPAETRARQRHIARGTVIQPLDLVEWLEDVGYEPEAKVTLKGELSLRGGILDLWPLTSPWPVRIEFFGDEIESLRQFDPGTQISTEQVEQIVIPAAGEFSLLKKLAAEGKADRLSALHEYLPADTILLLCEPELIGDNVSLYEAQLPAGDPFHLRWQDVLGKARERRFLTIELTEEMGRWVPLVDEQAADTAPSWQFDTLETFRPVHERAPDPRVAEEQRREFFHQMHRWLRQGYAVEVFCNNHGERQRFEEVWHEYGLKEEDGNSRLPTLHLGSISRGFICEAARLVVVADAEIFGRYKSLRPRRLKSHHAAAARSAFDIDFTDFNEGDFVVHLQHGIGRYIGIQRLKTPTRKTGGEDVEQEYLTLEYAAANPGDANPKLYVPLSEAHLVSKYVGAGKIRPALNTLGGTRWSKAKAQAEAAVKDLAGELLSIQAARDSLQGFACPPDTPWQREFESAFLYEETPDQMRSIQEAKRDMEQPRPMDRLVVGDVGFGKTEVAIRAAFKAVMSGKQVALLVPTTVLAQQHFNNFSERMADYPVRVAQLSRFCSKREQRQVMAALADGSVDIVIGTHRLLQADVEFKDLGLVIIDEEQRFGVLHKERFKTFRKLVDVLTLSATPIPRTLYLSLMGARDMSKIETAPQDRLPVETVVCQYDERVIRDAIQRELNRQGQVYFLHNRVLDIQSVALRIKDLVPKARVLVGHGQMDADELEEVMTKFINGEADVLVSTTIIESGIDIPNANTIIINRADRFGLSDLYQLRGRVGRYKHQAYAYLLLPRHAALLNDVRKRISAIKQYSSLGSGFKIAMRDLEIRGAGNLLGSEQSGHITAVGFELYCQLLKQSISAVKGEKVKPRIEVQMRLDFIALNPGEERAAERAAPARKRAEPALVPRETATYIKTESVFSKRGRVEEKREDIGREAAYIPFDYIPDSVQRIEIYRKLGQAGSQAELQQLQKEVRDRFGKLPPSVELLFSYHDIKLLAAEKQVTIIESEGDKLKLTRNGDFVMLHEKFPRLTKKTASGRLTEIRRLLQTF